MGSDGMEWDGLMEWDRIGLNRLGEAKMVCDSMNVIFMTVRDGILWVGRG